MKKRSFNKLSALSLISLAACLVDTLSAQASAPVFINEIHYDNDSADIDEFVEIAGPAGTDLTGWSVVFYNGNGGVEYATQDLSGILADAGNGMGMIAVYQPGIQNGAPDGIALVDNTSTVVQFLSYEGSFTAVDGPAFGMTSTDIGVVETSAPIGDSLQLRGTGMVYEDFTWAAPALATPGAVNTEQNFSASTVKSSHNLQAVLLLLRQLKPSECSGG